MRSCVELHAKNFVVPLGSVTRIMGIVNCTPDSFSGDGLLKASQNRIDPALCLSFATQCVQEGADILDVGGESTRPGAPRVSEKEEIRRVIPVIDLLAHTLKVPISVDTSKLEVARRALDAGASIINNVQGTRLAVDFLKMVRASGAALVLMHTRGNPRTMRSQARYSNLVTDVIEELRVSVEKCLSIGISKNRVVVDPGIGFAKTIEHNLFLIQHLDRLQILGCPILLGTSRKSFIGAILNTPVTERLMGTAASVTVGVMRGAHIVRVHDIQAIKETVRITDAILNAYPS